MKGSDIKIILNADDFGMCDSQNKAIIDLFKKGYITDASIMVPCPSSEEALEFAKNNPQYSIGVHLTLTSEWPNHKWGPTLPADQVPSLVDKDGNFFVTSAEMAHQADRKEIEAELRNQIETALNAGIKPTHIDNHMFSLCEKDFHDMAITFSMDYQIPFRFTRQFSKNFAGVPLIDLAERYYSYAETAIKYVFKVTDVLISDVKEDTTGDTYESYKHFMFKLITNNATGISELFFHPCAESEEVKNITPSWKKRTWEYRLLQDPEFHAFIKNSGFEIINWRYLNTT